MADLGDITSLLEDEEGMRFEEEISRNPYLLDCWTKYLDFKKRGKSRARYLVYERALKCLPRSYKLWRSYLMERTSELKGKPITDKRYNILINTYERALVHLHKMPRIWLDYGELLMRLKKGTLTRRTFDRALQALPITQHDRVWTLYLEWAASFGVVETAVKVFRRYLMFDPQHREEYVDYLVKVGNIEEASLQLAACVNDDEFISPKGHSKHALWMKLCDMCAKHPVETGRSLNVDAIIRSGLARFSDEVGPLWCKLADFYIRSGAFERARDVFEEAINSVITVRDFTTTFDTFAQFEESVLSAKMAADDDDDDEEDDEDDDADVDGNDVDLRLARLEHLMERRPLLLSSVLLRQNPHNVVEWQKRVELYKASGDLKQVIVCYTEAVKTVDPAVATGKPHELWLAFARFYEEHGDVASARLILGRAVAAPFKAVEDLAAVWCGWGEMELRAGEALAADDDADPAEVAACYSAALEVMQRAVAEPSAAVVRARALESVGRGGKPASGLTVQERVHKNTKVWTLYLDLEESLGTVDTTRAAYTRALELKIATPQLVLNFAAFLEEQGYFEESFTVYEKGVAVFKWPHVKPLWHAYLDKFISRYGGTKLERARELFEQATLKCPPDAAAEIFLKYAKLEEEHGLVRRAMAVYDRATKAVAETQRLALFRLYIKKAESFFGVTRTREIHEQAIKTLPDLDAQAMALDYASMERKLGEVDRARAILTHGAQFENPKRAPDYWKYWHEFEVAHGNEDTFRDMLRVKRSVATAFANETFYDMQATEAVVTDAEALAAKGRDPMAEAEQAAIASAGRSLEALTAAPAGSAAGASSAGGPKRKADEMEKLEAQAQRIKEITQAAAPKASPAANPEEIDLDDEDGDDAPLVVGNTSISQKAIPAGVFGEGLAAAKAEAEAKAEAKAK